MNIWCFKAGFWIRMHWSMPFPWKELTWFMCNISWMICSVVPIKVSSNCIITPKTRSFFWSFVKKFNPCGKAFKKVLFSQKFRTEKKITLWRALKILGLKKYWKMEIHHLKWSQKLKNWQKIKGLNQINWPKNLVFW